MLLHVMVPKGTIGDNEDLTEARRNVKGPKRAIFKEDYSLIALLLNLWKRLSVLEFLDARILY